MLIAQINVLMAGISVPGVPTSITLSKLAGGFIEFLYVVIGLVFFILIVYAGFLWLTAAGNPDQTQKATNVIVGAVAGAAIAFAAGAFTGIFESVFGITFI